MKQGTLTGDGSLLFPLKRSHSKFKKARTPKRAGFERVKPMNLRSASKLSSDNALACRDRQQGHQCSPPALG